MESNEEKLKRTVGEVFGMNPGAVNDDCSMKTVNSWDSLKHMNLILALEQRFQITFTEDETIEILSYPLIRKALQNHGVAF